ncbi:class I tRNA ligase family protein, partial [Thermodesulfovibrionales bacterium]|nr:class I tRNA ligase family protein [Thermodesulfovibrionales bacterium]
SALWPFSTLGWPEDTEDLRTFYPTNLLVTGFDILFFWVARMIMMGMKFMGDPPFRDVYIHALVRDLKGQKMSKSKGNIIDPLLLIDKYGADAFRFSLAALAARGRDIKFSEERIEGYRHFINKLWNATKFIINNEQLWTEQPLHDYDKDLDLPSRWIISRLASTASAIDKHLRAYRFSEAANGIYQFVWHEFCDWYIELTKPVLLHGSDKEKVIIVNCLFFVLEQVLQLLHPFMPFVTEEIWHKISRQKGSIIRSPYPLRLPTYQNAVEEMGHVINAVTGIRSIRGELNIAPSIEIEADIKVYSEEAGEIIKNNLAAIKKLTRCKEIGVAPEVECIKGSAVAVKEEMEIYVPISGLLDIGAEVNRLQKEMKKIDESLNFLNKKLLNADFLSSAPKSVLQKDKARFDDLLSRKDKIEETLKLFDAVKRETTAGPK